MTAKQNSPASQWSDEALMAAVRDGEPGLLSHLFERHGARLFRYLWRLNQNQSLSEDLAQEVFCRLLRSRAGFKDGHNFTAWMYSIARNLQMDHWRKRRFEAEWEEDFEPAGADSEQDFDRQEESRLLHAALQRLPAAKREILILSRFEELPHEQIATILGCEAGAARVRLHRALSSLRELYLEMSEAKPLSGRGME